MSYEQGYLSVNTRLDKKCGKGWEGTTGNCRRVKKKNKLAEKEKSKSSKTLASAAGAVASGIILSQIGIQAERQVKRKFQQSIDEIVDKAVDKVQEEVIKAYKKVSNNPESKKSAKSAIILR